MLKFDTGTGGLQDFMIEEAAFDAHCLGGYEAIFCQGNGYMGQRAALEERYAGQTRNLFVAGTFDRFDEGEVTELPNLPDLTNLSIRVDGVPFSMERGMLKEYSRRLNLKTGELNRDVLWQSPAGTLLRFCFRRFVSLNREHVLGMRVDIACLAGACSLDIDSGIDATQTNGGTQHFSEGDKRLLNGRILRMTEKTVQSGVVCRLHAVNTYFMDGEPLAARRLPVIRRRYLGDSASFSLGKGHTLRLEKLCCVHTSRDQSVRDGRSEIESALAVGYDGLMEESAGAWAAFWETADVKIVSESGYDQLAVRFALYHMNIMVNKDDDRVGIGAKGLTGEGYKGHSFWDTEIFLLPYYLLTQPRVARTLLMYRYNTLEGARRKAVENGYRGAMYPWESAWTGDGEVTPRLGGADIVTGEQIPILTGILEQHISADIAFAVSQYYQATGDASFMESFGNEIILETARFWASRAVWDEDRKAYVILDVIGPDEYKEHVDNNAYTNYMAWHNMRLALDIREDADIRRVADALYLPKPGEQGIVPQFDGYLSLKQIDLGKYKQSGSLGEIFRDYNLDAINGLQASKQADVLLLMLLMGDLFDEETKRRNYAYYEARTLHDSSLSRSTHCVLACDLKLHDLAYSYFAGACATDLPREGVPDSEAGIHSAAMGGIWQCAVYGFGGVRILGGRLRISPRLPAAWESLSFRIVFAGQPLEVSIGKQGVQVKNLGGRPVLVTVCGEEKEV